MKIPKNTVCLMFDKGVEEAARFYAEIFPNSSVVAIHKALADYPSGKAGDEAKRAFTAIDAAGNGK